MWAGNEMKQKQLKAKASEKPAKEAEKQEKFEGLAHENVNV